MNESAYQDYLDAFNSHNFEKLLPFYAEDVEFKLPNAPVVRGRDGIAAFYKQFEGKFNERVDANEISLSRDGTKLWVDMTTHFEFLVDFPDFLKRGPRNKGDKIIGDYLAVVCSWKAI